MTNYYLLARIIVLWTKGITFLFGGIMGKENKVSLVCEVCLSRNYVTHKNKLVKTNRIQLKKYCPKCNCHTLHKETK